MSLYVIKGPVVDGEVCANYLSELAEYPCPQWWKRESAMHFSTAKEAREKLLQVQATHRDSGRYDGRIVRIVSRAEMRKRRAEMVARISRLEEALRGIADLDLTDLDREIVEVNLVNAVHRARAVLSRRGGGGSDGT